MAPLDDELSDGVVAVEGVDKTVSDGDLSVLVFAGEVNGAVGKFASVVFGAGVDQIVAIPDVSLVGIVEAEELEITGQNWSVSASSQTVMLVKLFDREIARIVSGTEITVVSSYHAYGRLVSGRNKGDLEQRRRCSTYGSG